MTALRSKEAINRNTEDLTPRLNDRGFGSEARTEGTLASYYLAMHLQVPVQKYEYD